MTHLFDHPASTFAFFTAMLVIFVIGGLCVLVVSRYFPAIKGLSKLQARIYITAAPFVLVVLVSSFFVITHALLNPPIDNQGAILATEEARSLLEFLRNNLLEPATLERRHNELVQAIKEATGPIPASTQESTSITFQGLLVLLGAVLTIVFLVVMVVALFLVPEGNVLKKTLIGLGLFGFISVGVTVFAINFDVKDGFIVVNVKQVASNGGLGGPPSEILVQLAPADPRLDIDCGTERDHVFRPFPEGKAELEDEDAKAKLDEYINSLRNKIDDKKRLLGLALIGSADKRPLAPELIKKFGSNAGLAQLRAKWVEDQISATVNFPSPPAILAIYAGPSVLKRGASDNDDLATDRAVRVCELWG